MVQSSHFFLSDDVKLILELMRRYLPKLEVDVYLRSRELMAAGTSDCSTTSLFLRGPLLLITPPARSSPPPAFLSASSAAAANLSYAFALGLLIGSPIACPARAAASAAPSAALRLSCPVVSMAVVKTSRRICSSSKLSTIEL